MGSYPHAMLALASKPRLSGMTGGFSYPHPGNLHFSVCTVFLARTYPVQNLYHSSIRYPHPSSVVWFYCLDGNGTDI